MCPGSFAGVNSGGACLGINVCLGPSDNGDADNTRVISRSDYGSAWPFTPSRVTLICESGIYLNDTHYGRVFVEANGKKYAVNGTARRLLDGKSYNRTLNIHDFYSISRRGGNIARVISDGLKLC